MKNKIVIIVGGGEDAMKKAVYAQRAGAEKIYIAVRSSSMKLSEMRRKSLSRIKEIEILYNTEVTAFMGTKEHLSSVILKTKGTNRTLDVNAAIISIGRAPNTKLFTSHIETDSKGFILLKYNSQSTSVEGVFAAGDVTSNFRYGQGAIAAGDGMKAGYEILDFMKQNKRKEVKSYRTAMQEPR